MLAATILGSSIAFIDISVVSVALPAIQADLDAALGDMTWVVNAFVLFLASLILIGGSLGDHLGRRRVFVAGVVLFAVASAACALAPERRGADRGARAEGRRRRDAGAQQPRHPLRRLPEGDARPGHRRCGRASPR